MSYLEENPHLWTPEPNTGCFLWLGPMMRNGYAQKRIGGKNRIVGRFVLEEAVGPPPGLKMQAAHATPKGCCGKICVNPAHLRWATASENMLDEPPAIRSARRRKGHAGLTAAQRSENARKGRAGMTPERRSEIVAKGHVARRKRP